ncbi:hypothetical protein BML2526_30950 [Providencia rettgeri]|nr:hypothetical protein BML2526_30950 [Providencia rettgeri]BBV04442.1 hypothetical protein BML2531_22180 [Providencia rettgeri]BBV12521.1 hypothetical protein BML2576_19800 [Providencia rettgeri]BDH18649.1 hypothetical protein PrNR1418_19400 [Providencia rettgeri]
MRASSKAINIERYEFHGFLSPSFMIIMLILPDGSNTVTPRSMFQRLDCFKDDNGYDKNAHGLTYSWYSIKIQWLI